MTEIAYTALVDQALNELAEGEKAWAATSLARRREILDDVQQLAVQHGAEARHLFDAGRCLQTLFQRG